MDSINTKTTDIDSVVCLLLISATLIKYRAVLNHCGTVRWGRPRARQAPGMVRYTSSTDIAIQQASDGTESNGMGMSVARWSYNHAFSTSEFEFISFCNQVIRAG